MVIKGLREISAIATLLIANAFFGISDKTTSFIFPQFGEEVFTIINFYTNVLGIIGIAFILVLLYRHFAGQSLELPTIPSTSVVIINFGIFLVLSYVFLTWIITGNFSVPIPDFKDFIEQNIIGANENTIAFIFLVTIFPATNGIGNIFSSPINIFTFGQYQLNFNPPNLNRFLYGFWGILIITLLHAGAYSFQVSTFDQFYVALVIAWLMFWFLWLIKETFGFGACIAFHVSWNLVLLSIRGSVF